MMLKANCPNCGSVLEAELKVSHPSDDYVVGSYSASAMAIMVSNPSRYYIGTLVYVPRTGERMLTTCAPGTSPITVRRGILKTKAAAILDNEPLELE